MNKEILRIIEIKDKDKQKEAIDKLEEDIKVVKKIIAGEYRYCPECKDYYLAKSFIEKTETKREECCTYSDPINSGGNEYAMKDVRYNYTLCPKDHKLDIKRYELY